MFRILSHFWKRPTLPSPMREREVVQRFFQGAASDRFSQSWIRDARTLDERIYESLGVLRSRSRELCLNNASAKKFLRLVRANVVGPQGVTLQCEGNSEEEKKKASEIERAFEAWGKRGTCDVTGTLSWKDVQRLVIQNVARDGEAIIRIVRLADNPFGFALQIIAADHLDDTMRRARGRGENPIIMGIEKDDWGRPEAYYFRVEGASHATFSVGAKNFLRVPAEEIIHVFVKEDAEQTRGFPWMHAVLWDVNMLRGYQQAELVSSRIAASKMGFYTSPDGEGFIGDDIGGEGSEELSLEAGSFQRLPAGSTFTPFDPTHPQGNFDPFVKACLRNVASGLGVSYASLSGDLEGVNFSSIRAGVLEERDEWMVIQDWFVENFCNAVFKPWLMTAMLAGKVPLRARELATFETPKWIPRRWHWVDPLKDSEANILAVQNGLKSRSQVCAEQGREYRDILEELKSEEDLARKIGVMISPRKERLGESSSPQDE